MSLVAAAVARVAKVGPIDVEVVRAAVTGILLTQSHVAKATTAKSMPVYADAPVADPMTAITTALIQTGPRRLNSIATAKTGTA